MTGLSGLPVSVVSAPHPRRPARSWLEQVVAWDAAGVDTLLVPDAAGLPSVVPALAAAAAVTTRIRLRPWVLAAPLRSPQVVVREVSALQHLSDGRAELGIGTGRPDAAADAAALGVPWPARASERLAQLEAVVSAVREGVPDAPVVVAAAGPKALAVAGRVADVVALATPPHATGDDVTALAATATGAGGPSGGQRSPRLAWQLVAVGDRTSAFVARSGATGAGLRAAGAAGALPADAHEAREQIAGLVRRCGIGELVVPEELAADVLALRR